MNKINLEHSPRLTNKSGQWTISIDDGYKAYKFTLNASKYYSIFTLAETINQRIIHHNTWIDKTFAFIIMKYRIWKLFRNL